MLKITSTSNGIVVKGVSNYLYPSDGELTFPFNSLTLVLDDSDIATFKNQVNDVVFSGLIENITIDGESVTKDTIIDKFAAVANKTSQGGGGEGGMTPEEKQELKDVRNDVERALGEIAALDYDKQDKLTAGDNIKIENNVISATGAAPTLDAAEFGCGPQYPTGREKPKAPFTTAGKFGWQPVGSGFSLINAASYTTYCWNEYDRENHDEIPNNPYYFMYMDGGEEKRVESYNNAALEVLWAFKIKPTKSGKIGYWRFAPDRFFEVNAEADTLTFPYNIDRSLYPSELADQAFGDVRLGTTYPFFYNQWNNRLTDLKNTPLVFVQRGSKPRYMSPSSSNVFWQYFYPYNEADKGEYEIELIQLNCGEKGYTMVNGEYLRNNENIVYLPSEDAITDIVEEKVSDVVEGIVDEKVADSVGDKLSREWVVGGTDFQNYTTAYEDMSDIKVGDIVIYDGDRTTKLEVVAVTDNGSSVKFRVINWAYIYGRGQDDGLGIGLSVEFYKNSWQYLTTTLYRVPVQDGINHGAGGLMSMQDKRNLDSLVSSSRKTWNVSGGNILSGIKHSEIPFSQVNAGDVVVFGWGAKYSVISKLPASTYEGDILLADIFDQGTTSPGFRWFRLVEGRSGTAYPVEAELQKILRSGENIKTINGQSLLGSGNIEIEGGGGGSDAKVWHITGTFSQMNYDWKSFTLEEGYDDFNANVKLGDIISMTGGNYQYIVAGKYGTRYRCVGIDFSGASTTTLFIQTNNGLEYKFANDVTQASLDMNYPTKSEVNQEYLKKSGTYVKSAKGNGGSLEFEKGDGGTDYINMKTVGGQSIIGAGDINVPKTWKGTEAEYNALTSYDDNTVYYLLEE